MKEKLEEIAKAVNGKIDELHIVDGGHGFATISYSLPKDHWLYEDKYNVPPMPWRIGNGDERLDAAEKVRAAARYAIRASTDNGKIIDFDPDAMVKNFIVGLLGYWTPTGLSSDAKDNPSEKVELP